MTSAEKFKTSLIVPNIAPMDRTTSEAPKISIISVCFDSSHILQTFLSSLNFRNQFLPRIEVIIVNNYVDDEALIKKICEENGVCFVQSPTNVGYGSACNAGARLAKGEFLFFVNPDVSLNLEALTELLKVANSNPGSVAFGPIYRSQTGKLRYKTRSLKYSPRVRCVGGSSLPLKSDSVIETNFLSGGAMMVRQTAFFQIDGFDENIFLFHEDDDICIRLEKLGNLLYARNATVIHDQGGSSPRSRRQDQFRSWHLGFSKVYVGKKNFGRKYLAIIFIEAISKIISPINIFSSRRRAKSILFFCGVMAAIQGRNYER